MQQIHSHHVEMLQMNWRAFDLNLFVVFDGVAAPLVAEVSSAAPLMQLDLRPSGTLDVSDRLDSGELDIGIGTFDTIGERFARATLLEDRFVAVMRRDTRPAVESCRRRRWARFHISRFRRAVMTPASSTVPCLAGVLAVGSLRGCPIFLLESSSASRTWWPR